MRSEHWLTAPTNRMLCVEPKQRANVHKAVRALAKTNEFILGTPASGAHPECELHLVMGVQLTYILTEKRLVITEIKFGQFPGEPWWTE